MIASQFFFILFASLFPPLGCLTIVHGMKSLLFSQISISTPVAAMEHRIYGYRFISRHSPFCYFSIDPRFF